MFISTIKIIDRYLFFSTFYKLYRKVLNNKKLKIYETTSGKYYLPKFAFKDIIKKEIIENRIFDEEIYNISKSHIQDNSIVLDAGANYGQMSILFSKLKKNILVYSFESSKYIFKILKKNIEINKSSCLPINCILGNESGTFYNIKELDLEKFNTYGSNKIEIINSNNALGNTENVKTLKIDEIEFKKNISFFKIDVQGYDLKVLKGAKETILKHKMPIVFEYEKLFEKDYNYTFKDFEDFIDEINYDIKTEINNNYLIIPK